MEFGCLTFGHSPGGIGLGVPEGVVIDHLKIIALAEGRVNQEDQLEIANGLALAIDNSVWLRRGRAMEVEEHIKCFRAESISAQLAKDVIQVPGQQ